MWNNYFGIKVFLVYVRSMNWSERLTFIVFVYRKITSLHMYSCCSWVFIYSATKLKLSFYIFPTETPKWLMWFRIVCKRYMGASEFPVSPRITTMKRRRIRDMHPFLIWDVLGKRLDADVSLRRRMSWRWV